jgi:hypothetical protein
MAGEKIVRIKKVVHTEGRKSGRVWTTTHKQVYYIVDFGETMSWYDWRGIINAGKTNPALKKARVTASKKPFTWVEV